MIHLIISGIANFFWNDLVFSYLRGYQFPFIKNILPTKLRPSTVIAPPLLKRNLASLSIILRVNRVT